LKDLICDTQSLQGKKQNERRGRGVQSREPIKREFNSRFTRTAWEIKPNTRYMQASAPRVMHSLRSLRWPSFREHGEKKRKKRGRVKREKVRFRGEKRGNRVLFCSAFDVPPVQKQKNRADGLLTSCKKLGGPGFQRIVQVAQ